MKLLWQPARISLLTVILGSTLWVLGRAIATPQTEKVDLRAVYTFPAAVPLAGWQPLASTPLAPDAKAELPPGRQYQYHNSTTPLDVEARVMIGNDSVGRFLLVYTPIGGDNVNLKVKYQPEVGSYGVLAHEGRAYLTACINRQGGSTVTEQQFMQNRKNYGLQVSRILPWLLGRETLIDRRCLWTLMSTPLSTTAKSDPTESKKAFKTLESAWFSWYQWWQPNFLKP